MLQVVLCIRGSMSKRLLFGGCTIGTDENKPQVCSSRRITGKKSKDFSSSMVPSAVNPDNTTVLAVTTNPTGKKVRLDPRYGASYLMSSLGNFSLCGRH